MRNTDPVEVKVRPMQPKTPIYRRAYRKLEPYIPKTSGEGKGLMYSALGLGAAGAIFLIGNAAANLVSSSNPANVCGSGTSCSKQMQSCTSQLNSLITKYNTYSAQFYAEDAAKNISPTQQQTSFLNSITAQENQVMQNCVSSVVKTYNLDFVQNSIQEILSAISIAIVTVAGAKALSYILKKGYFKKPPQSPGGGMQVMLDGMIDYWKATGQLPATWSNGKAAVQAGTQNALQLVQNYTTELVNLNIVDATIAASIVAAETATLAETEALVIAVLA